jgi:hypothetical protein
MSVFQIRIQSLQQKLLQCLYVVALIQVSYATAKNLYVIDSPYLSRFL